MGDGVKHASKQRVVPGKYYLSGNEAIAEGSLAAGCTFFGGYPITPSSEIAESMSHRLFELGGVYVQMEDELASIASIIGASWSGAKSMTATSGPGVSLMLENLGLAAMTETPCVIVNVQRGGPSTGLPTIVGQQDIMQARWGSHGDYRIIALSPWSVQESFDMAIQSFNFAEKYRIPVILLSDECIGHMMEALYIPPVAEIEIINRKKPKSGPQGYKSYAVGKDDNLVPPMAVHGEGYKVFVTGLTHNEKGYPDLTSNTQERLVKRLCDKIDAYADEIIDYEFYEVDDAEIVVVAYGITARAAKGAIRLARAKGIKAGLMRLKVIWPFPEKIIRELSDTLPNFLVAEINYKQIWYEVDRCAKKSKVNFIGRLGSIPTPNDILAKIEEIIK
jgi:2-oxoglutarate ferredoxin oxidoreductase subunit alpha